MLSLAERVTYFAGTDDVTAHFATRVHPSAGARRRWPRRARVVTAARARGRSRKRQEEVGADDRAVGWPGADGHTRHEAGRAGGSARRVQADRDARDRRSNLRTPPE